jgi:hypothetical protein
MQLSPRPIRALAALGAAGAFVVACSSTSTGFGSFGGTVSGSGGPVGSASPPSSRNEAFDCPTLQPKPGDYCGAGRGVCEYGQAVDPACTVHARCSQGVWLIEQPSQCPTSCPDHFDDRAPGDPCSDTQVCTYLEATCGCVGAIADAWTIVSYDPDAGAPPAPAEAGAGDAGADAAVGHWQCVRPGGACPARRPIAGSRCVNDSLACDYGTCLFGVPLGLLCSGDHWTGDTAKSCP